MTTAYRIHLSMFPLGSSEPARALAAVREVQVAPSWISRRQLKGGWLVEAIIEIELNNDEEERALTERLTMSIWQRIGRYVKVAVDASSEESDLILRREWDRAAYLRLMRTP
jgi:hypothetical protein